MLSGINAAVVRIQDRRALLKEACRLAHRVGGYPLATISTVDSASRTVRPEASAGLVVGGIGPPALSIADSPEGDTSISGRVVRTGEAVFCEDIGTEPLAISGREHLIAAGVRSVACLP